MDSLQDQVETTQPIAVAYRPPTENEMAPDQPPVLSAVFRSIFIEIPKDFFGGFGQFFKRYYVHYKSVFRYFHRPVLQGISGKKIDYKESSQLSFEISLLLLAALLFMIKQNWIPVDVSLQEMYGNDILQMLMEFFIFVLLAVAFFTQLFASVLLGRVQRQMFKIPVTRKENDTLYCLLNNSFFSLAALMAFFFRLGTQYEQIKDTNTETGIYVLCFLCSILLTTWWSFRFTRMLALPAGKKVGFHIFSILLLSTLYGLGMSAICAFVLGS